MHSGPRRIRQRTDATASPNGENRISIPIARRQVLRVIRAGKAGLTERAGCAYCGELSVDPTAAGVPEVEATGHSLACRFALPQGAPPLGLLTVQAIGAQAVASYGASDVSLVRLQGHRLLAIPKSDGGASRLAYRRESGLQRPPEAPCPIERNLFRSVRSRAKLQHTLQ